MAQPPIGNVSKGTLATSATSSVSPAYAAATTAGNFVAAQVWANVANAITTTAPGWNASWNATGSASSLLIAFKYNCGASETAPSFSCTSATSMAAVLTEWSGVSLSPAGANATGLGFDQGATAGVGTTSPFSIVNNSGTDSTIWDVCLFVASMHMTKSATLTLSSVISPGSDSGDLGNNNSTKIAAHFDFAYVINHGTTSNESSDSITITPSTGAISGLFGLCASFAPPIPPPQQVDRRRSFNPQIRASHWRERAGLWLPGRRNLDSPWTPNVAPLA